MDLQPKLTSLAAALREDRDKLLTEWLGTLRIGLEKPGGVLTDTALRNHFAELLEDLCNQLEVPLTQESEITALKHAETHGDTRWTQGYKLPELIREEPLVYSDRRKDQAIPGCSWTALYGSVWPDV